MKETILPSVVLITIELILNFDYWQQYVKEKIKPTKQKKPPHHTLF